MIIVDTGVILAVADASDADHDRCDELLAANPAALVVPTPVIVEGSWLIEDPSLGRSELVRLRGRPPAERVASSCAGEALGQLAIR